MKNGYTLEQFNNDMHQLGGMIENFYSHNGGKRMRGGENEVKLPPKNKSPSKNKSPPKNKPKVTRKEKVKSDVRRYKVLNVNGAPYPHYRLYRGAEPKDAAKKAGKFICKKLNMGKECKLASFELQETTRGSDKRVYGPYVGEYEKLPKPRKLNFKGKPEFIQTHKFVVKLKK